MKKILLFLFIFSIINVGGIFAQNHAWCGTTDGESIKARLIHNRALMENVVHVRNAVTWVPIQFHILTNDDGSNGTSPLSVLDMLCAVNEDYADQEVQFYLKDDFNYINKTSVNNNPNLWNPVAQGVLIGAKVLGAVNVYISSVIPSAPGSSFQSAGFYQTNLDYVVIKRDQVSPSNAETLTHELGHFFSLPHPFDGWAQDVTYTIAQFGNPAPVTTPSGAWVEKMDGSNCMIAGDLICDTPPSYNFGTSFGCNYTGGVMDPNEVLVDPDETNFMDYFLGCATNFTTGQKTEIFNDITVRGYGASGIDDGPIDGAPVLTYPINEETTPAFNVVGLDWEPVNGATKYLVEVDKFPNFGFKPNRKVVSAGTYVEFEGLVGEDFNPGTKYYWRVKPYNEGNFCGQNSAFGIFRAGDVSSAKEIKEILNYKISPNPISSKDMLNINIETNQGFDANISLYDLAGKKVKETTQNFAFGTTQFELSVTGLSQGMYILSIESETGILNEKIIVTK